MLNNDGMYIDGSWMLTIHIDTLGYSQKIRVQGNWSIGKVIAKLVEELPSAPLITHANDAAESHPPKRKLGWSEYKLWWPGKRKWLIHYSSSLYQTGLHADALLRFTPTQGPLRIRMPDLQYRDFHGISYSEPVFRVVLHVCRQLGIRHPEELSLMLPLSSQMLKKARKNSSLSSRLENTLPSKARRYATLRHHRNSTDDTLAARPPRPMSFCNGTENGKDDSSDQDEKNEVDANGVPRFGPPSLRNSMSGHKTNAMYMNSQTDASLYECLGKADPQLAHTPMLDTSEVLTGNYSVVRPQSFLQKCRLNSYWLDSAKSLMEQSVDPFASLNCTKEDEESKKSKKEILLDTPELCLKFKYGTYYDLNIKFDAVRINQLYQQAKWSIVAEVLHCSDEEAIVLAALQLQSELSCEENRKQRLDAQSHASLNHLDRPISMNVQSATTENPSSTTNTQGTLQLRNELGDVNNTISNSLRPASAIYSLVRSTVASPSSPRRTLSMNESERADLDRQIEVLLDELTSACLEQNQCTTVGRNKTLDRAIAQGMHRSRHPSSGEGSTMLDRDLPDKQPKPPHLSAYLKIAKPRKFGIKTYRRCYIVIREACMHVYKNADDCQKNEPPLESIDLRGCIVEHDMSLENERYAIRLFVPLLRSSLPIYSALKAGKKLNANSEDLDLITRLKNRASFLSLTSLANFVSGGLSSSASFIAGLLYEIDLSIPDDETFVDWLAMCQLYSSVDSHSVSEDSPLTLNMYEESLKSVKTYMNWLAPIRYVTPKPAGLLENQMAAYLSRCLHEFVPARMLLTPINAHLTRLSAELQHSEHSGSDGRSNTLARLNGASSRTPHSKSIASHLNSTIDLHNSHSSKSNADQNELRLSIIKRILQVHEKLVPQNNTNEAKLRYISLWQLLSNHGIAYFIARFQTSAPLSIAVASGHFQSPFFNPLSDKIAPFQNSPSSSFLTMTVSRKDEALGIDHSKLYRCDLATGEIKAAWRLSSIQGWHVNFELNEVVLYMAPVVAGSNASGKVIIRPVEVSVKLIAEFLGGYAFLNMRAPAKRQQLDESTFYKLTSGTNRLVDVV